MNALEIKIVIKNSFLIFFYIAHNYVHPTIF